MPDTLLGVTQLLRGEECPYVLNIGADDVQEYLLNESFPKGELKYTFVRKSL